MNLKVFFVTFLLSLFVKFCSSSLSDDGDFYFRRALNDLKNFDPTPDVISAAIRCMNCDSVYFEISRSILEQATVIEYVQAHSQISSWMKTELSLIIDFKSAIMKEYAAHLLISMESSHEFFSEEDIINCAAVVMHAFEDGMTVENQARYLNSNHAVIGKLSVKSRRRLYELILNHASKYSWFIGHHMLTSDYLPASDIQLFMKSYFEKVRSQFSTDLRSESFNFFFLYAMSLGKSDFSFETDTIVAALMGLKQSIAGIKKPFVSDFITIIQNVLSQNLNSPLILPLLSELSMSEYLLQYLTRDLTEQCEYTNLLLSIYINDKKTFKAMSAHLKTTDNSDAKANFEFFNNFIVDFHKFDFCFSKLEALTTESTEDQTKIALISVKNLHEILKRTPNVASHFQDFAPRLLDLSTRINEMYGNSSSASFNVMVNQIMIYFSLIKIDLNPNSITQANYASLAYFVGRSLSLGSDIKVLSGVYHLIDPLIVKSTDAIIKNKQLRECEINIFTFSYYLAFIRLNPDKNHVQEAIDSLSYLYITSYTVSKKAYMVINNLDFVTEPLVLNLSFEYYLKSFLESDSKQDAKELRKFFQHCIDKKALNKTQVEIFNKWF